MGANSYVVGDVIRVYGVFTANGVATDPTTITLYIKSTPTGQSTFTYAGAQIVRDSIGNYHYDYTTTASGTYYYRYEATGTVVAAAEGIFAATSNFK